MEKRGQQQEEPQFERGELVWAKITGFPWWPARLTRTPHTPDALYRVDFLGDSTHAFLTGCKITKYREMRGCIERSRHMSKRLRMAIAEADAILEQQDTQGEVVVWQASAGEMGAPELKQLPQQALLPPTPLQENFRTQDRVQAIEHSRPAPEIIELSSSSYEECTDSLTREQRQRMVNRLLKKYRLFNLPKITVVVQSGCLENEGVDKVRRKQPNSRRPTQSKTKRGAKPSQPQHTLSFLLSRKIYSLLKEKEGLPIHQRKQISLSLSREILCGNGGPEEVSRLFKWVSLSPTQIIANFYDNWGMMQGDKEKPSYMTTEE